MRALRSSLLILLVLAGCDETAPTTDAGTDAGPPPPMDAGEPPLPDPPTPEPGRHDVTIVEIDRPISVWARDRHIARCDLFTLAPDTSFVPVDAGWYAACKC